MPWFISVIIHAMIYKCNNTCHDLSVIIHTCHDLSVVIHAMIYKCNNTCHDLSVIIHAMI